MFRVIKFNEQYLENFVYNGLEIGLFGNLDIKKLIKQYAIIGDCFMGLNDDKMIAIAGIYPIWTGVGEAWMLFNQEAKKHTKQIIKEIRKQINEAFIKHKLHRLQTISLASEPRATRLLEVIGFIKEGTLRDFAPDKSDMSMYTIRR